MFNVDSIAGELLVFVLLSGTQLLLLLFLVWQEQFFANVILLDAQEAKVNSHPEVLKPVLPRRELFLEHPIVMRLPDPAVTDVQDLSPRVAQNYGLGGVALFFPE